MRFLLPPRIKWVRPSTSRNCHPVTLFLDRIGGRMKLELLMRTWWRIRWRSVIGPRLKHKKKITFLSWNNPWRIVPFWNSLCWVQCKCKPMTSGMNYCNIEKWRKISSPFPVRRSHSWVLHPRVLQREFQGIIFSWSLARPPRWLKNEKINLTIFVLGLTCKQ